MREKKVVIEVGDGAAIPDPEDKGLFTAWRISFFGTIAIMVYLVITKPDPYLDILKYLPDGIVITFKVTFASIALALVLGLVAGLGRISKNKFFNLTASTYIEVVRGIPLLVQLFYIYFALGHLIRVPDLVAELLPWGFVMEPIWVKFSGQGLIPLMMGKVKLHSPSGLIVLKPCVMLFFLRHGEQFYRRLVTSLLPF